MNYADISPAFRDFLPTILQHEGGFVDDPDDPGGATNKGITLKTFQAYAHLVGVEPTLANLKQITSEQAGIIYYEIYWKGIMGDQITDGQVAQQYVDFYINAGSNAVRVMQQTVNEMGQTCTVDGAMGPNMLKCINALPGKPLFQGYKINRAEYYENLVKRNPKLGKFLKGWLNRTNSFVYK